MSYLSTIIVVEDVLRSRELYEGVLGLKVDSDFGIYNVGFEGGLRCTGRRSFRNWPETSKSSTSPTTSPYISRRTTWKRSSGRWKQEALSSSTRSANSPGATRISRL